MGRGGVSRVSRACGLSRKSVSKGIKEIQAGKALAPGRIRHACHDFFARLHQRFFSPWRRLPSYAASISGPLRPFTLWAHGYL
jgi:hypothetical protein